MIQTKQLQPQIIRKQLTVREIDKATGKIIEPGVIFNPVVKSNQYLGQWVYVPTDIKELQSFVNQKIYQ